MMTENHTSTSEHIIDIDQLVNTMAMEVKYEACNFDTVFPFRRLKAIYVIDTITPLIQASSQLGHIIMGIGLYVPCKR